MRTRLELLALEAADEKARLLKLLGLAFAALLFLTLAVLVATITIAVAFWPTEDRYLALGLLAACLARHADNWLQHIADAGADDEGERTQLPRYE